MFGNLGNFGYTRLALSIVHLKRAWEEHDISLVIPRNAVHHHQPSYLHFLLDQGSWEQVDSPAPLASNALFQTTNAPF